MIKKPKFSECKCDNITGVCLLDTVCTPTEFVFMKIRKYNITTKTSIITLGNEIVRVFFLENSIYKQK